MFIQVDEKNKVIKNIPTARKNIIKPDNHKLIISDHPFSVGSKIDWNYFKVSGEDYMLKTDIELYLEGLKEIPVGMKVEDKNLVSKTVEEKLEDGEITEEWYIAKIVRPERDNMMKFVLNRIDQYEKELKQVELEIITETSWSEVDYQNDLVVLQALRDLPKTIDSHNPVYPEISGYKKI